MQDIQDALNLLDAGRPTEAIPMVQELAQQRPAYAAAYVLLARLHESAGHWEEARAAWEQARFLMPNSPAVAEGLQRVRRAMEDEPDGQPPIGAQPGAIESDTFIADAESDRVRDLIDTANEDTDPDSTDPDSTDPDSTDPDSTDPDSTDPDKIIALQALDAVERLQADAEEEMERAGSGLAEEAASGEEREEAARLEPVSDVAVATPAAEEVLQDDVAPVAEATDTAAAPVPEHEAAESAAPPREEAPIVEEPEPIDSEADVFVDASAQAWDEDAYLTGHDLDETAVTGEPVEAETEYVDLVEAAEDALPETYAEEDIGPIYDSKGRLIEEDLFLEIEQLIDEKLAEEGIVLPAIHAGPERTEEDADDAPDETEATVAPSAEAPIQWPPPGRASPARARPALEEDDDLDSLIDKLESARILPGPDLDALPPPDLDDEIEDMVSETLARIYASQAQYHEAARVYEQLAIQHPDRSLEFLQSAADMRSRAADG